MSEDDQQHGVAFPADEHGRRSTSDLGRAVVADALRAVDPTGAMAAEREAGWRAGYLTHHRRLVEAGLSGPTAATSIARAGLSSLRGRLRVVTHGGETALDDWPDQDGTGHGDLRGVEVAGTGERVEELGVACRDLGNVVTPLRERADPGDARARYLGAILGVCEEVAGRVAEASRGGLVPCSPVRRPVRSP